MPFLAERGPSRLRLYLLAVVPVARLLLLTTAILWIVPIVFNITFQNFLVIAGAASVAIGFAFKDYVSSLIAGVVAIFERPYRPGDWVKIGGDYGEVRSVGMRAIRVLTADANVIVIPHSKLWTDNISNSNDGAHTLMCVADFYLAPQHDAAAMRSVLQDVALTSAYLDYARARDRRAVGGTLGHPLQAPGLPLRHARPIRVHQRPDGARQAGHRGSRGAGGPSHGGASARTVRLMLSRG